MADSSLPRHLALALNLSGIGVYDPAVPPDRDFFTWLARKHQYRSVGFAPPLLGQPDVDAFAVYRQEAAADLPEDQVLRHVRIAGYGMLDSYESMTAGGYRALLEGTVDAEHEDRTAFAAEDARERFWRFEEEASGETWVGGYFDALPAFEGAAVREALESNPDLQVGLGLVGGFVVDPPYD